MRLSPLYTVKLIADGKSHFYTIGNDPTYFPGVTTVLGATIAKPQLLPWAVKACSDNIMEELTKLAAVNQTIKYMTYLEPAIIERVCTEGKNIYKKKASEAADIGSRVHQAIDLIIRGEIPTISEDIKSGVQGFIDWQEKYKVKIEAGDTKIASKIFGYGGSLDFIAFIDGEPVIFDNKTTKKRKDADHGIYPEYAYQLAAYAQAFHETYGLEVKQVYCLWLNKEKPEFKAVKISNLAEAFQGFLSALKLYKLSKYELFDKHETH